MNHIDGMLALVIARDAQARLSEAELSDQAEVAQGLNDKQAKLRDVKKALRKALSDNTLNAGEMVKIKEAAEAAGIGDEVGAAIDALYALTDGGRAHAEGHGNWDDYASADAVVDYDKRLKAEGKAGPSVQTHLWINETSDVDYMKPRKQQLDNIREAIDEALDNVKGEASGQELELQMASQEYSRATQLASNLLNVRNDVFKALVQAIRS